MRRARRLIRMGSPSTIRTDVVGLSRRTPQI
jgi:hypothetical protein